VILNLVGQVRHGMYGMLRSAKVERKTAAQDLSALEGIEIERVQVHSHSPAAGQTLAELELRPRTGASIMAVRRADETHTNPDASFRIEAGDVLILLGDSAAVDAALALLDPAVGVA
jgi:K+/H+ antiporter YhaU regulatory subunit KhtT